MIKSHPAYGGKSKAYTGFPLIKVFQAIDENFNTNPAQYLEVTTEDGWTAPKYNLKKLFKGEALLAIRENKSTLSKPVSKDRKWSLVVAKEKTLYPGPFFIVWNDSGKNPDIMPLQVKQIKLIN